MLRIRNVVTVHYPAMEKVMMIMLINVDYYVAVVVAAAALSSVIVCVWCCL